MNEDFLRWVGEQSWPDRVCLYVCPRTFVNSTRTAGPIGSGAEYGMDRVETIQSSPNPRATDPNPVQSS